MVVVQSTARPVLHWPREMVEGPSGRMRKCSRADDTSTLLAKLALNSVPLGNWLVAVCERSSRPSAAAGGVGYPIAPNASATTAAMTAILVLIQRYPSLSLDTPG